MPLQLFTGTTGPDVLFPGLGMSALDLQELSKCLLEQALPLKRATPAHQKKSAILGVPLPTAPASMKAPYFSFSLVSTLSVTQWSTPTGPTELDLSHLLNATSKFPFRNVPYSNDCPFIYLSHS